MSFPPGAAGCPWVTHTPPFCAELQKVLKFLMPWPRRLPALHVHGACVPSEPLASLLLELEHTGAPAGPALCPVGHPAWVVSFGPCIEAEGSRSRSTQWGGAGPFPIS